MSRPENEFAVQFIPRRAILKSLAMAPLLLRAAPLFGTSILPRGATDCRLDETFSSSDTRFLPHYPAKSPLGDVISLVNPGADEYTTEKYAAEIESILKTWGVKLVHSPREITS